MREIVLKAIALVAMTSLIGCVKRYECKSYQSLNMQCYKGADTVQYFTAGYIDPQERVKQYYESLGYNCDTLPYYFVGGITYTTAMSQHDIDYLESEGFDCELVP